MLQEGGIPKTISDNNWWNRSFKSQTQVNNEFVKQEFVKKKNFAFKSESTRNISVLESDNLLGAESCQ